MSNNYFQCKQFTVFQDRCAMKVGTDGILLGAWADMDYCRRVLDIGTGTGLVSLMLAQRYDNCRILSLDVDENAVRQAENNFRESLFLQRLEALHVDFKAFAHQSIEKFDAFVCNPPFFKDSPASPNAFRTLARHDHTLSLREILEGCNRLCTHQSKLSLIFPFDRKTEIETEAQASDWYVSRQTIVFPKRKKSPNRLLVELSKEKNSDDVSVSELVIYEADGAYTGDFVALVKDFYLKL